ncbi:MAG TPA: dihydropteroate synthase [Actinomycetota bacterium]
MNDVVWARGRLPVSERTLVMGIVNVTPDSFSDGGSFLDSAAAIEHGLSMVEQGADVLDVGGESTRPGAEPVPEAEEIRRVVPVIEGLSQALSGSASVPISIDTTKSAVARAALAAGASIVNDVGAARADPAMLDLVAEREVPIVLMHMQGEPRTMQANPTYGDVVADVKAFLAGRARAAVEAGVPAGRILVDPGFGFGKTLEHNLTLLRRLGELTDLGYPVLVGTSRKSFIGAALDLPVEDRLEGTAATVALAVANGASVVRVHDCGPMRRIAGMVDAVMRGELGR